MKKSIYINLIIIFHAVANSFIHLSYSFKYSDETDLFTDFNASSKSFYSKGTSIKSYIIKLFFILSRFSHFYYNY